MQFYPLLHLFLIISQRSYALKKIFQIILKIFMM